MWLAVLMLFFSVSFAQQGASKAAKKANSDDEFNLLLDNSRPGKNHAELGKLSGTWNFQYPERSFVKGTLVRKSLYDGRFYTVEITGGKLQLPIADGKMKEDNFRSMQLEGFDNPKGQFFTTSINNHIGSDIEVQVGSYDAGKKEFTYTWTSELIRGIKTQNKRVLRIIDADHYKEEYYEQKAGKYVKSRELDYTKLNN